MVSQKAAVGPVFTVALLAIAARISDWPVPTQGVSYLQRRSDPMAAENRWIILGVVVEVQTCPQHSFGSVEGP
jgi:hypothetical protein